MSDIVLERQTYILVASPEDKMFPADDLYPSDDLYPADMTRVSNIVSGTMQISEILCDRSLEFGQLYSTKFEVQVYDTEDLSGNFIVVLQEENNQSQIVFTGIIDSCKQDRLGYDRTIVAYDLAYSKSYMNVASWWENYWDNHQTATLKQLRESLLTYAGIKYEDVELINDTTSFTKSVSVTSMPFGTMLKMICELSCCFPHFTRKGMMEFIVLNDEEPIQLSNDDYEGENSTFEEYTTSAITGIQFYSSSGSIIYTEGTSGNPYSVSGNLLVFNLSEQTLETVGDNMLDYISELVYTPVDIKMIIGDFGYKVGDYITTSKGSFYLLKNEYSGSQLIEQRLIASGNETREQVGVEISIPETIIAETVEDVVDSVDGAYEMYNDMSDVQEETLDITETVYKHIDDGDNYVLSVISSTTGQEVWDTTGYYFTDANTGYESPTATYESSTVWSDQGYDIDDTYEGIPRKSDRSHSDVGKYYMDNTNGDIYIYKCISSATNAMGTTVIGVQSGTQTDSYYMHKVASGVADSYEYDWDIYPDLEVGSYYLDCEAGKIYQHTYENNTHSWTLVKQCDKVNAQFETRISQTETDIQLEATARTGADSDLSSRITVNANAISSEVSARSGADIALQSSINQTPHSISMSVSGSAGKSSAAGITISLYDANGNFVDSSSGNIYIDGNVIFSSQLTDGVTQISGSNITTGTISADRIYGGSIQGTYLSIGSTANTTIWANSISTDAIEPTSSSSGFGIGHYNKSTVIDGKPVKIDHSGTQVAHTYDSGFAVDGRMKADYCTLNSIGSSSGTDLIIKSDGIVNKKSGSSKRYKNSISTKIPKSLDPHKLYDVPIVKFKYNKDYITDPDDRCYDKPLLGFIAEDLDEIYPIACNYDAEKKPSGWDSYYIIPPMLALIQEQNKRIEALENKITQLEGGN